jgi:hypothetical protein
MSVLEHYVIGVLIPVLSVRKYRSLSFHSENYNEPVSLYDLTAVLFAEMKIKEASWGEARDPLSRLTLRTTRMRLPTPFLFIARRWFG